MRIVLYTICAVIALCVASCTDSSSRHHRQINEAEQLMQTNADNAMAILDNIDPSYLKVDSIKAKYHYLRAYGHMRQNRSMIGDSLIAFAHNFYSEKDIIRDIRSSTAYAWYKFWVGDTPGAISMLDSIVSISNVPDSLVGKQTILSCPKKFYRTAIILTDYFRSILSLSPLSRTLI